MDDYSDVQLVEELEASLQTFYKKQDDLRQSIDDYKRALTSIHSQQDKFKKSELEQKKELTKLTARVRELEKNDVLLPKQASMYCEKFQSANKSLREVTSLMPRTGSFFLWLFLGKVNVVIEKHGDRFHYKEEYERFKQKLSTFVIPFSLFAIVFPFRFFDFAFNIFLTYYYLTLSIRENILKVNGSNIARWWSLHHFLSLALSIVLITWPYGRFYQEFRFYFFLFSAYLSFVQLLQVQYQKKRLYTLRALGRASDVDVADTDSGYGIRWAGSMWLLIPVVFVGQGFQIFNGVTLVNMFMAGAEWQAGACGVLFAVLGAGNCYITLRTLLRKR